MLNVVTIVRNMNTARDSKIRLKLTPLHKLRERKLICVKTTTPLMRPKTCLPRCRRITEEFKNRCTQRQLTYFLYAGGLEEERFLFLIMS